MAIEIMSIHDHCELPITGMIDHPVAVEGQPGQFTYMVSLHLSGRVVRGAVVAGEFQPHQIGCHTYQVTLQLTSNTLIASTISIAGEWYLLS